MVAQILISLYQMWWMPREPAGIEARGIAASMRHRSAKVKAARGIESLVIAFWLAAASCGALANSASGNVAGAKTVDDVTIYLAVTLAEMILEEYPKSSPERQMHGGVPHAKHEHHVMITLFGANTGKHITMLMSPRPCVQRASPE